jgi:mannose-6-phosphate isomerase-like protein (cupin superfamily)
LAGFECRDTGIGAATEGLAGVRVVRRDSAAGQTTGIEGPATGAAATADLVHDGELRFWFVLAGTATLHIQGRPDEPLDKGSAVAIPAGTSHFLAEASGDLQILEVTLPDVMELRSASH